MTRSLEDLKDTSVLMEESADKGPGADNGIAIRMDIILFGALIWLPIVRRCPSTPNELVIFLHGRLEADDHEAAYPYQIHLNYTQAFYQA